MKTRQKICATITFLLFLFGTGAAEAERWCVALMCLIIATVCIIIGGLDKKKTNAEKILNEWRIH